jgi:hypothetical protein
MDPISLTLGQKFEIEKFSREIDNSDDLLQLRSIAKDLASGLEAAAGCFCLGFSTISGSLIKHTFVLRVVDRWSRIKQLCQLN